MILEGTNINSESSYATNQAVPSLAQLIKCNSVKHKRRETTIRPRHTLSQEMPLPVYLELMIHSKTRVKGVIKKLATLGLSVTQEIKQEIEQFDEMGLVCPRNLKSYIYATAAIHNIDHNLRHQLHKTTFMGRPFQYFNILQINPIFKYKIAYQ